MDLWERIRTEVRLSNTTQAWVAKEAGIPFGTFQRWLSHKTMPNADQIVALAKALGTTAEFLVSGEQPHGYSHRIETLIRDLATLPDDDIDEIEAVVAVKIRKRRAAAANA